MFIIWKWINCSQALQKYGYNGHEMVDVERTTANFSAWTTRYDSCKILGEYLHCDSKESESFLRCCLTNAWNKIISYIFQEQKLTKLHWQEIELVTPISRLAPIIVTLFTLSQLEKNILILIISTTTESGSRTAGSWEPEQFTYISTESRVRLHLYVAWPDIYIPSSCSTTADVRSLLISS